MKTAIYSTPSAHQPWDTIKHLLFVLRCERAARQWCLTNNAAQFCDSGEPNSGGCSYTAEGFRDGFCETARIQPHKT